MENLQKMPLSESGFQLIRSENLLYVDKTRQISRLLELGRYLFLSRPRRFGKSLLVSTLKALFQGKRQLFQGLYIADQWQQWDAHPVLHLDFSKFNYRREKNIFLESISLHLSNIADEYEVKLIGVDPLTQFTQLIEALYQKKGLGVVVLIDEYDKPILDFFNNPAKASENRELLREFYTTLKVQHEYLRLVFVTGVSKLAKVSVFSGMNNVIDVSLRPEMNDILGITHQELLTHFPQHLAALQQRLQWDAATTLDKIKFWYNGYSWNGRDRVYNPFSIVNLMSLMEFKNFWFETGTPTLLVELVVARAKEGILKKQPTDYQGILVTEHIFDTSDLEHLSVEGLLFQTGYLTVEEVFWEGDVKFYTLTYPNYEVRTSFTVHILEKYASWARNDIETGVYRLKNALKSENLEAFFELLQSYFAAIPYQLRQKADEAYYHSIFQMLFMLIGVEILSERSVYNGRIDGVIVFEHLIYVIELKYAQKGRLSALKKNALAQMEAKRYADAYRHLAKPVVLVGIGFLDKDRSSPTAARLEVGGVWKRL